MAKIIIEFSDSYSCWFSNSIEVFNSICQFCPDVKKPILPGDVVSFSLIEGPHVSKPDKNSES